MRGAALECVAKPISWDSFHATPIQKMMARNAINRPFPDATAAP
jgi:hypothetical protein